MKKKRLKLFFILIFGALFLLFCYICIFNSRETNSIEGVTMTIKDGTLTRTSATIIITDVSEKGYLYGESFQIFKKEGNRWKELVCSDNCWFHLSGYSVDENHTLEMEQNWSSMYGELTTGEYQLVKKVGNQKITTEFEIQ